MPHKTIKTDKSWIIYDPSLIHDISDELFEQTQSEHGGSELGRGQVVFFNHNDRDWVLKHYQRGGLIQKLCRDSYIYTGMQKTRMACEFHLLQRMHKLQLPVPRVLACRIQRNGLTYKGDLITEKIPKPITLIELLSQKELSRETWAKVGKLVATFHANGVYHADLNANNILRDNNSNFYLIDFDKAQDQKNTKCRSWQSNNLMRLKRSLKKAKQKKQKTRKEFYFNDQDWAILIKSYQETVLSVK